MRSMGEGHALVILTFWRGDTLNVPLHHPADGPPPRAGEEFIRAGAHHVCLDRPTGEIGPSLR
jgi:hypothetical protein